MRNIWVNDLNILQKILMNIDSLNKLDKGTQP